MTAAELKIRIRLIDGQERTIIDEVIDEDHKWYQGILYEDILIHCNMVFIFKEELSDYYDYVYIQAPSFHLQY